MMKRRTRALVLRAASYGAPIGGFIVVIGAALSRWDDDPGTALVLATAAVWPLLVVVHIAQRNDVFAAGWRAATMIATSPEVRHKGPQMVAAAMLATTPNYWMWLSQPRPGQAPAEKE